MNNAAMELTKNFRHLANLASEANDRNEYDTMLWGIGVIDVLASAPDATEASVIADAMEVIISRRDVLDSYAIRNMWQELNKLTATNG